VITGEAPLLLFIEKMRRDEKVDLLELDRGEGGVNGKKKTQDRRFSSKKEKQTSNSPTRS